MEKNNDYNKIMSDKKLFYETIYTSLPEALKILEKRQKDKKLLSKIEKLLDNDIPEPLKDIKKNAVQFRQIATPNSDCEHFIGITSSFGLQPVFFEYFDDKFTSNNEFKHSLGQLRIHDGINKYGDYNSEKMTIIDFNKYNGKKIKEVFTLKSELLIDFHRELFDVLGFKKENFVFYDASAWFKNHGKIAEEYYTNFFLLFVTHGILFENFLTKGTEGQFSKNITLPALDKVIKLTGLKPLIVPIPPMEIEEEEHWISYHPKIKKHIKNNLCKK
ncbi:MAG: hypothetical protein WCG45_04525 [bacterium]